MSTQKNLNYAIDVDGVLANFGQAIINKAWELGWGCDFPENHTKIDRWMFSGRFMDVWTLIEHDENFWLGIPPFEEARRDLWEIEPPAFYITKRPVASEVTSQWLKNNLFPIAPVITVADATHKLQYLLAHNVDAFIDDLPSTIREVRADGVNGILYAAPFQISENIEGLPIIHSLKELPEVVNGVSQ
jgi:hypothetical protein